MLLCNDPDGLLLPPLTGETETMEKVYDFELMEQSGHLRGWLLRPEQKSRVAFALRTLKDRDDESMLFAVGDGNRYLTVPEGLEVPEGLDGDIAVIQQPLDSIYLVATSAMDLFRALDGIGSIRLSGADASGWYI